MIAGVLIAIIVQITMNLLGLAIGAAVIDPSEVTNSVGPTFSTGAVIWIAASTLLGIFAGGYVAGHLSGNPDSTDGVLHGLLTWALGTVVVFLLLSTTASSVVSSVSTLLSQGIELVGAGVEDVAPEVVEAFEVRDEVIEAIRSEAGTVNQAETDNTNAQLVLAVGNLLRAEADTDEANEARNVTINLLTEQTDLSESEAQAQINDWEQQYRQAVQNADDIAITASENLADALAASSSVLFLVLIVGAFAGGAGGFVGRPD
ncbi:MAG: hypothetical protein AAF846_27865 [Chloroflexota bacterium]